MELTLEELEQEQSALESEARNLLYTLEALDTLSQRCTAVGVSRNDVLSIEQLSGSALDVNPNYFTEVPSQTNLNLAMEGLMDKMNAGVLALFGLVAGIIIAAFVWISKLFRSSSAESESANAALAAAQQQLNLLMVAEAASEDKVLQTLHASMGEILKRDMIPDIRKNLTIALACSMDPGKTQISYEGGLKDAASGRFHLSLLLKGVEYVNPNDPIMQGMVYRNFDAYLTSMMALVVPAVPTQESYNKEAPTVVLNAENEYTAQPIRPLVELFDVKSSLSKKTLSAHLPMELKTYAQLRDKGKELMSTFNTPQGFTESLSKSTGYDTASALLNPITYIEKHRFDLVLVRYAELYNALHFDTKSAAGRVDEITKSIERTLKKIQSSRNSGGIPDSRLFNAYKNSLHSARADANLLAAFVKLYTDYWVSSKRLFKAMYTGMQNLQREMQAQLTTEESETLKRLIRDSKKNSDDMLERIKQLADVK